VSTTQQATTAHARALGTLRAMMTARWIDAVEEELVQRGEAFFQLGGAGHEASAVLADHLGPHDWMQPHYRSRALLVRRGLAPERFFHGLLSTGASDSAGRQMPAFLNDPALKVLPMPVPTGNGLLHAVGVAREVRDQPDAPIVIAGIGDGTTQQGEVMEAIGEAAREGLPVLFWIEDNGYAISTHTSGRTFYDTAMGPVDAFLGAPIVRADGRDPITLDALTAPRRTASTANWSYAVEKTISGMGGSSASSTPKPSRPGIRISKNTRSGASFWINDTASSPSVASPTISTSGWPFVSRRRSSFRASASSSATTTRSFMLSEF